MEATEESMRNLKFLICVIAILTASFAAYPFFGAKKITIKTIPEFATIYIDGQEVGTGTYQVKFDKHNEFYVVSVEAPGVYYPKIPTS